MRNIPGNLVTYQGKSIPELDIRPGMNYDQIMEILLNNASKPIQNGISSEDVASLISGITSDDIKYSGPMAMGGATERSSKFQGFGVKWNSTVVGDKIVFSYDATEVYDLSGENLHSRDPEVTGYGSKGTIQQNNQKKGVLNLPYADNPLKVKFKILFLTKEGDIELSTEVQVPSIAAEGNELFEVNDFSTATSKKTTYTDWSTKITATINSLTNTINSIKSIGIKGTDKIEGAEGIGNCLAQLYAACSDALGQIEGVKTVPMPDFGTCANKGSGSIEEALNATYDNQKSIISAFNELKTQIEGIVPTTTNILLGGSETSGNSATCVNCGNQV